MADTAYGVNASEAVKLWSRKLAREALRKTYIKNFMGPGSDSMIQVKPETNKGPGDSPCRRKDQQRRIASDRVIIVWR